jgi:hypothetical protein
VAIKTEYVQDINERFQRLARSDAISRYILATLLRNKRVVRELCAGKALTASMHEYTTYRGIYIFVWRKLQLKFEIHKIIMVNYMFLICCSQFRASSVSRCSLEKPCWNLVRGHSSKMCWMVSFSAPHSQEGFSRMFQWNNILLHIRSYLSWYDRMTWKLAEIGIANGR